jgi:hypothetical protein
MTLEGGKRMNLQDGVVGWDGFEGDVGMPVGTMAAFNDMNEADMRNLR